MNSSPATFTPKSPLYWFCGALALGISLVGLLAIFAPQPGSEMFGIPVRATDALSWVRLAGVRDIALGLVLFATMTLQQGRTVGILILLSIVIPITDAITVFLRTGLSYHFLIHACSILYMISLGVMLLRRQ
jgi:Domain of unknown function (DUF4267)